MHLAARQKWLIPLQRQELHGSVKLSVEVGKVGETTGMRVMLTEIDKCLIGPGVFDGVSAHVASSIGFDFLYLAGSGTSGSRCGHPDLSIITQTELADVGRMVASQTDIPVLADADTGFGGPLNIARTIRMYQEAGIAACHIEDQVFPKRCGQLRGKTVVSLSEFLERIRSAVEARRDPDFVIVARTDARQAVDFGGPSAGRPAFEEGVRRLKAALDAGADMAFMESPRTEEECQALVKALAPKPVLINVLPHASASSYILLSSQLTRRRASLRI